MARRQTRNRRNKTRKSRRHSRRHTRRLSRRNLKYVKRGGNLQANAPSYMYPLNTNQLQLPVSTTNPPLPPSTLQKGGIGSFGVTNLLQGAAYNVNTLNAISNGTPVSSVSSPYPFY